MTKSDQSNSTESVHYTGMKIVAMIVPIIVVIWMKSEAAWTKLPREFRMFIHRRELEQFSKQRVSKQNSTKNYLFQICSDKLSISKSVENCVQSRSYVWAPKILGLFEMMRWNLCQNISILWKYFKKPLQPFSILFPTRQNFAPFYFRHIFWYLH